MIQYLFRRPSLLCFPLAVLIAAGCTEDRDDFGDSSFNLVNQYNEEVIFPDDFKGSPVLVGFVYTHCPDICSLITANLHKVYRELDEAGDIQFLIATFDPKRDTPEVLLDYARSFNMDRPPFMFLTGDEDEVKAFMQRAGVRSEISETKVGEGGKEFYLLNHTDKILLIDRNARLVMDYGGSMTPTNIIIEDLQNL